jgi:hypothetical protein
VQARCLECPVSGTARLASGDVEHGGVLEMLARLLLR